jgi:hypothetical protein
MDTRTAVTHSLIGQHKYALDTPALLVDLDVMESNIARIVATCRAHGVAWRPHFQGAQDTGDRADARVSRWALNPGYTSCPIISPSLAFRRCFPRSINGTRQAQR